MHTPDRALDRRHEWRHMASSAAHDMSFLLACRQHVVIFPPALPRLPPGRSPVSPYVRSDLTKEYRTAPCIRSLEGPKRAPAGAPGMVGEERNDCDTKTETEQKSESGSQDCERRLWPSRNSQLRKQPAVRRRS